VGGGCLVAVVGGRGGGGGGCLVAVVGVGVW